MYVHEPLRDMLDPMHRYKDNEFKRRFRFSKDSVLYLENFFFADVTDGRGPWVPVRLKLLILLRVYATNGFQTLASDVAVVSQSLACETVKSISKTIASRMREFIKMPTTANEIYSNCWLPASCWCN